MATHMTTVKKLLALLLSLMMALSCAMPALADEGEGFTFTDSLGRTFTFDEPITRIAVTAPLSQIVVFAIAPDLLVGVAEPWDDGAIRFLDEEYYSIPVLGQLYGGRGGFSLEELLNCDPQVVIDVGEPSEGLGADLDNLTEQTGIPFIHVTATIDSMDACYTMLGSLLGREEQGALLGDYCVSVYNRSAAIAQSSDKPSVLYVLGDRGLNVLAKGSYHSTVLDMMTDNAAVVDNPVSKGTGNEVDMEQMLIWNPDVIIFAQGSIYDTVGDDPLWQGVSAIANGRYYEAPVGPYNWMGYPPSVQRLLGMMWMTKLLYPDQADYDLYEETAKYFELFYHCELTPEQYDALMQRALPRE